MEITFGFNIPKGVSVDTSSVEECTVDISIKGLSVVSMRKVLSELSEMTLRDFARLAALTSKTMDEDADKAIESGILRWCSMGSSLDGAVLPSGIQPLKSQPR